MIWPFGRRKVSQVADSSGGGGTETVGAYPWQPASTITGNFAIGGLRENLLQWMTTDRGVHVESLAGAVGALAGFAGQCAALSRAEAKTRARGHADQDDLLLVQVTSGETYLYGELLNQPLFGSGPDGGLALWNIVGGAAVQAGVPMSGLPDFAAIARRTAQVLGSPDFEKLGVEPAHQPHMSPRQALAKLWAATEALLRNPLPKGAPSEPPLQEVHWPVVLSLVAGQVVGLTKDALDPRITARIIVEAAVIASKIHPDTVTPGRWKIAASAAGVTVARL